MLINKAGVSKYMLWLIYYHVKFECAIAGDLEEELCGGWEQYILEW